MVEELAKIKEEIKEIYLLDDYTRLVAKKKILATDQVECMCKVRKGIVYNQF